MSATDVSAVSPAKRDFLVNNIPEAVSNLAKACELLLKQFEETAKECAEAYYDVDYVKNVKGTNLWRKRILKVANDISYNFAVSNKSNFQHNLSEFGLDCNFGDKPTVTTRAGGLKYKMAAGFSVDNLAEVVRGVKSGEVKAYTKSEGPPHNSVNSVKVTNTICANVQERMYQTSPKPVQETVSR